VVSSFVNTPYDRSRLADPNVTRWKLRVVQALDALTGQLMVERFHAVSEGAKSANACALRIPEDRITVAERGRDQALLGTRTRDRRSSKRAELGLTEHVSVVLNLGRLDHQKGQTILLAATSILMRSHPDLVVLVAGKDGSASADVRQLLDEDPELAKHIRLLGHRSDVGDLLCAADVLAVSSHFEGTAGAALEAMALSTPIVSTDVTGLRGVLQSDQNAVLVETGSQEQLAAGIARLLDDPVFAGRIAETARREFLTRFTLGSAAERLRVLYQDVARPK
jgi:glycosyltransferase involved in cell wall biosynthesis